MLTLKTLNRSLQRFNRFDLFIHTASLTPNHLNLVLNLPDSLTQLINRLLEFLLQRLRLTVSLTEAHLLLLLLIDELALEVPLRVGHLTVELTFEDSHSVYQILLHHIDLVLNGGRLGGPSFALLDDDQVLGALEDG